jgi:biopolymer transport protein ExbB
MERIEQGKAVGYVILAGLLLGLILVIERWARLSKLQSRINNQLKDLDHVSDDNPLGRIIATYYENEHLGDLETISRKLEAVVIKDVSAVTAGLPIIKILATVAPLTGLLGTVVGMIETFQSITLFGTGDPKLMAGGISMALITTVLGLVAAIPLLISHTFLSSKASSLSKVIAEQAAGMMAMKAEQIAIAKQDAS